MIQNITKSDTRVIAGGNCNSFNLYVGSTCSSAGEPGKHWFVDVTGWAGSCDYIAMFCSGSFVANLHVGDTRSCAMGEMLYLEGKGVVSSMPPSNPLCIGVAVLKPNQATLGLDKAL